ncbi:MAG: fibronectin type III domain-containing protein [Ruminococcus sp.]|nr:fibronectin type III domain-containing protein [Ruminococcus sp.]
MKKQILSFCAALALAVNCTVFEFSTVINGLVDNIVANASSTVVYNANEFDTFKDRTIQDVADEYSKALAAGSTYVDGDTSSYYSTAASLEDPYSAGVVTADTLEAMQAMTNFHRWLLGLDELTADCTVSDAATYNLQEQAFCRNWYWAHDITALEGYTIPEGMDEDLWAIGVPVNHNILASGFTPRAAITGWLNEGYNLSTQTWDTLGHRWAILQGTLSNMQYGYCGKIAIGRVVSKTNTMDEAYAAFPAPGYMPNDMVEPVLSSWSVELNTDVLSVTDTSDVTVTITNLSDNTVFTRTGDDILFETGLAANSRISFIQPDDYNTSLGYYDDSYTVVIDGLTDASGNDAEIKYTVNFVDISSYTSSSAASVDTEFSTYYVYSDLNTTEDLTEIASILPDTVRVTSEAGLTVDVEVSGEWKLDEENSCWTNSVDNDALPSTIIYNSSVLSNITIPYEITSENTTLWSKLSISPSSPSEGDSGYMAVYHYYSNFTGTRIYQVTTDDNGSYIGTQRFDSQTSEEFDSDSSDVSYVDNEGETKVSPWQYFNVECFTQEDNGDYISFYYNPSYVYKSYAPAYVCNQFQTISGLTHTYDNGVVTTEATCTEDGVKTYTCSVCGETYTEAITATGHTYTSEITKEATCTEDGVITYTCTACGDTYTEAITSAGSHTYDEGVVTTAATCTEDGVKTYTCTACGETYTEAIAATGHNYVAETTKEATTDEEGLITYTCSNCGDVYTETIPALGHSFTSEITTEPTCTEDGVMTYTCTDDGCGYSYTEVIPATGHTEVIDEAVDATCTETGLTEGSHCSVCGEVLEEQEVIPATGHSYTSKVTTAATCGTAGVRTYTCSNCGDTYTESIAATGEHSYTSEITQEATCVSAGTKTYTCSVCGDTYTEAISATGEHSYTSSVTKAATCAETGVRTYTCSVCGDSYTETIAKTSSHSYTSKVTTAATCTTAGVRTYTCSVCGDTYTTTIAATGHSYTSKITTAATCGTAGVRTYTCSNCGDTYTTSIAATGNHTYTSKVTKAATCTTAGTRTYTCSVCGDTYTTSIAATGHSYTTKTIAATYAAQGYTLHTCSNCGNTYKDNYTAKKTVPATTASTSFTPTASSVKISWTKVSVASGYQVQRYNSSTSSWSTVKTITSGSTTSYTDSSLSGGTTYKYRVRAYVTYNGTNYYGSYSSTITTTTKPAKVTASSSYTKTTSAITIKWTKVSGASGYQVQRYNSSSKSWSTVKTITSGSTVSYKNTGLSSGTTYKYRVRAYTTLNGTKYYGSYSSTITTSTKPAKVTISSTSKSKTAIKLTWKKVTGASGYQVQRYNSSTKKWVTVKTIKSGSTVSYKNTGLKKGTTYKYRIRAYRTVNGTKLYGAWSSTKKVTTKS